MKKKVAMMLAAVAAVVVLSACNSGIGLAGGYGHTAPGVIYSQGIQGGTSDMNVEHLKRPYKHLGRVSGESFQTNVLLLVTLGDASIETAQKNALLQIKEADALINRNIDVKHTSILGLFTTAILRVTGDAIQYTDKQ